MKKILLFAFTGLIIGSLVSCKSILIASTKMGRKNPGISEKFLKKIFRETHIAKEDFVFPDQQSRIEVFSQLTKNEFAYPFVFYLDENARQVKLPDSLSVDNCLGVLEKYLLHLEPNGGEGEPMIGSFFSAADSAVVRYEPGIQYLVLVYSYSLGTSLNWFYRSMSKFIKKSEGNKRLLSVMITD